MGSTQTARYESARPYIVPDRLTDLVGPRSGIVTLPTSIDWAPTDHTYDLDDPDDRRWAYMRVVREATTITDLERLLDADLLIELWPSLFLPPQCRDAWERRFPELAKHAAH